MNIPLTKLQQFLGAYFNQDWVYDYTSADEVIDSYLTESPRDTIVTVKEEILELKKTYTNEQDFQDKLLREQHCYYYYPHEWTSGKLWLEHVISKIDTYLHQPEN